MDKKLLYVIVTFLSLLPVHYAQGNEHPGHGDVVHSPLHDSKVVHDQQHIADHVGSVLNKPKEEMTDDELQFYYFKLHDYDSNGLLDGVELGKAMTHHDQTNQALSDGKISVLVDAVLQEDDFNNDGYVAWEEFLMAKTAQQKRDQQQAQDQIQQQQAQQQVEQQQYQQQQAQQQVEQQQAQQQVEQQQYQQQQAQQQAQQQYEHGTQQEQVQQQEYGQHQQAQPQQYEQQHGQQ